MQVSKIIRTFVPLFKQVENPRGRCVLRSGNNTNANYGLVNVNANNDSSNSNTNNGARLTIKAYLLHTQVCGTGFHRSSTPVSSTLNARARGSSLGNSGISRKAGT